MIQSCFCFSSILCCSFTENSQYFHRYTDANGNFVSYLTRIENKYRTNSKAGFMKNILRANVHVEIPFDPFFALPAFHVNTYTYTYVLSSTSLKNYSAFGSVKICEKVFSGTATKKGRGQIKR